MEILIELDKLLTDRKEEVEAWLAARHKEAAPHIYTSVDLRHSGVRLAPVDTNLFPAGFNNLSDAALYRASSRFAGYLKEKQMEKANILILPENHTRNIGYLESLLALSGALKAAGASVEIGSLIATPGQPLVLATPEGEVVEHALVNKGGFVETNTGFRPDLILLNNDLTSGMPAILEGIRQPIVPPVSMGWYRRRKTVHFAAYDRLATEFAHAFSFDPWLINAYFHQCGTVNFAEKQGLECVAKGVDKVIACAREKHEQYGISEEPYVFIKADSGTYGMGIMTARSGDELLDINKKTRNKMNIIKEGAQSTEVIIQEGIPTIDSVGGNIAEPMIYLVDGVPVGGAYRVNASRDAYNNLNAQGMEFTGMCDESERGDEKRVMVTGCDFCVFGLVAALAALAAAREDYTVSEAKLYDCRASSA